MSLFSGMNISASALTAERARMNAVAENLANANTTRGADGQPYRRKVVVLQEQSMTFAQQLGRAKAKLGGAEGGVKVAQIAEDPSPPRLVYQPTHPDAGPDGYVRLPNINPAVEMADLITASRSYEANVTALNTSKQMFTKTLEILR